MHIQKNKFITKIFINLSIGVLFLLLSALVIENFFSKRIVYRSPEIILSEREKMINQYGAQEITLITADNHKIAAMYVKRPQARRIFLICHGYKHSKEKVTGFLNIFDNDDLFFIDFRGHGQSDGNRVSLGLNEYLDVVAACDYIKKNISSTLPLYGLGISMGGAAVLRAAAAGAPFDAVISDSAPSSFKDTVACVLRDSRNVPYPLAWLALTWYELIMRASFSESCYKRYAPRIHCPVLLMHDEHDHLINYNHAENLFNGLASRCKFLWRVSGTRHGKMHKQIPQEYKKTVDNFIDACRAG